MPDHLLTRSEKAAMAEISTNKSDSYELSNMVVDADRRELSIANKTVTVQPKAFELLLYLIRNRHRAVDKDELQDALWPRSIVTETALTRCVMKARRHTATGSEFRLMLARINAGEAWNDADAAMLEQFRATAGSE